MRLISVVLAASLWLAACNAPSPRGRGESCQSLSECKEGLACVEGACSADPTPLAEGARRPPGAPPPMPISDAGDP